MDMSGTPETEDTAPDTRETPRQKARDSMFLSAIIVFDGSPQRIAARVRNISSGGMMIDMTMTREKGLGVTAQLKNVGDVRGSVAWSTQSRMGISFEHEIDPLLARHKTPEAPVPACKMPFTKSRRPGLAIR